MGFGVTARQAISGLRLAVFSAAMLLAACATPPPPAPVAVVPPPRPLPALALLNAENQGYVEGVAAGERIQSRRDRARALAAQTQAQAQAQVQDNQPKPPVPAPPAPVQPTKTAVAAPDKPLPVAAPPQISYDPVGPATPVASPAAPGGCGSGFAGCD
jgi:hypothetical protein